MEFSSTRLYIAPSDIRRAGSSEHGRAGCGGRGMQGKRLSRRAWLRLIAWAIASGAVPSALQAAPPEPRNKPAPRRRVIALDPGHGGIDPGAIGASGLYEKEVTFETVHELTRQLGATRRYKVFLTRTSDEFVALRERVARARAANAELFLSVHADALPNPSARGASVFTLSEQASDREAAA